MGGSRKARTKYVGGGLAVLQSGYYGGLSSRELCSSISIVTVVGGLGRSSPVSPRISRAPQAAMFCCGFTYTGLARRTLNSSGIRHVWRQQT